MGSPEERLGLVVAETFTVEKVRSGESEPYEVVTVHSDGTQTVWRREED